MYGLIGFTAGNFNFYTRLGVAYALADGSRGDPDDSLEKVFEDGEAYTSNLGISVNLSIDRQFFLEFGRTHYQTSGWSGPPQIDGAIYDRNIDVFFLNAGLSFRFE